MHGLTFFTSNNLRTAQTRLIQRLAPTPCCSSKPTSYSPRWQLRLLKQSHMQHKLPDKAINMTCSVAKHRNGESSVRCSAQSEAQQQNFNQSVSHIDSAYVDHSLNSIGAGRYQLFVLFCVSLIWAGDAMEVMVLSYLGPAASCAFNFSSFQQSLLASVVFGGMVLGAACWGILADTFGRKPVLLLSCGVVMTAGLASAASPTYTVLLMTRCLVGFGLAGAPVAFTLLLEVLPSSAAATWGTLIELAWTAGTVLEARLAWGVLNSSGWRWLLLLSTAPMVLLLLVGTKLSESPRFLVADGQLAAAQDVLHRMAAVNGVKSYAAIDDSHDQDHHDPDHHVELELDHDSSLPQQRWETPHTAAGSSGGAVSADCDQHDHQDHQDRYGGNGDLLKDRQQADLDLEQQALLERWHRQRQQQQEQCKETTALLPHVESTPFPGSDVQHHPQSGPAKSSQIQLLLQEMRYAAATLSQQPYASTAALMMFGWATTSFAYYGLVQLVAELHVAAAAAASSSSAAADGPQCIDGMLQVPTHDYISVLVTSAAEVPAVAWAAVSANWLGNKAAVCTSLLLTAACLLPCVTVAVMQPEGVTEGVGGMVTDVGMFGARLFVMSAFTLMWVFTPELFPTHVRALALGINNASARVGGLLSPFAAVSLVSAGATAAAEVVLGAALLLACGAVVMVPARDCVQKNVDE